MSLRRAAYIRKIKFCRTFLSSYLNSYRTLQELLNFFLIISWASRIYEIFYLYFQLFKKKYVSFPMFRGSYAFGDNFLFVVRIGLDSDIDRDVNRKMLHNQYHTCILQVNCYLSFCNVHFKLAKGGLDDWENFVFWVIFSKIFKHRVQDFYHQVH